MVNTKNGGIHMKIKMLNKKAQMNLTGYQIEMLKEEYNSQYKDYPISEDLAMFARIYTGENGAECLSLSAEMAFNGSRPDVWCKGVFRSGNCYVEAGFYITDAWQSTGDNCKELQDRAYIRRFELVK